MDGPKRLTPAVVAEPCPPAALDDKVGAEDDLEEVVGLHEKPGVVGLPVLHETGPDHRDEEYVGEHQGHVEGQAVHQKVRSLSSFKLSRQVLRKTLIKSHQFPCS